MPGRTAMRATIFQDGPVSPRESGGEPRACAFPATCCLANGDIVCVYRRGKEKHSRDGVFVAQRSGDAGRTWSEPVMIFDGLSRPVPESVHGGAVVPAADGALLAMFTAVPVREADSYIFSETGRQLEQIFYVAVSPDSGRTWGEAVPHRPPGTPPLRYINSRPLALPDGDLLVPVEITTPARRQAVMMTRYAPAAGTFAPAQMLADDESGRLSFGDPKLTRLADGRILMWLWAFLNEGEETIQAHECVSADDGRTWSPPRATTILCQCAALLGLPDGSVLAVANVRQPPEGIRLWRSPDGGRTWNGAAGLQMWDARKFRMLGEPLAGVAAGKSADDGRLWEALPGFTFGTPDLVASDPGSFLLTYYAVTEGFAQVRACRFGLAPAP